MQDMRRVNAGVNTAVLKADLMEHIRQAEEARRLRREAEERAKQQQTKQS